MPTYMLGWIFVPALVGKKVTKFRAYYNVTVQKISKALYAPIDYHNSVKSDQIAAKCWIDV
jgi:hypothetical protein